VKRAAASLPIYAVLAAFVGYPAALLAAESVTSGHGLSFATYARFVATPYYRIAMLDTVLIATAATIAATVLGVFLAFVFTFVPFRGRHVFSNLINLMIVFPTFLIAFAVILVYGSSGFFNLAGRALLHRGVLDFVYTWKGIVLADAIVFTPFVMQPVLASMRLVDRRMMEVAQTLGSTGFHTVRTILLPMIRPGIFAGSSICHLLALNEYGIVAFLGSTSVITLPIVVYSEALLNLNLAMSATIAVVSSAISIGLFAAYRRLSGRLTPHGERAR
jgi:2-aminoethylphosphonate transport system permease protein